MILRNPNPDLLPISQDDEFLPPVSGWTIFGGFFLVGTVAIAFTVSAFTPLPVTVKAPAVVRQQAAPQSSSLCCKTIGYLLIN